MKKTIGLLILLLTILCIASCNRTISTENDNKIKVGVFKGHGGAEVCQWEAYAAAQIDNDMSVRYITSADIANGVLDSLDAIIIPGGGGSRQYLNLGHNNIERIKNFIADGGGAVGICAGAYLFSNTPDYSCMSINGAMAIDIEHDNRGHGVAKFSLSPAGKQIFPEIANDSMSYVMYYEGPVFVEAPDDTIKYEVLAIMESDVHEEGNAPANMTNDKPFFIANSYGKGLVFSCIAHPEATPGMQWMIPRMVRLVVGKPLVSYPAETVNPYVFNKEILFTVEMLKKEQSFYSTLLQGTPTQKIDALQWLKENNSWSAKRWVQGLVYDSLADVRVCAAKYISDMGYLTYLPDLISAHKTEKDADAKNEIGKAIEELKLKFDK